MAAEPGVSAAADETPTLSPPPKSRTISIFAVAFSSLLLLLVVSTGGRSINRAPAGTAGSLIGWILSAVGVLGCGVVLWRAVSALLGSRRAAKSLGRDRVLEARAHAARAIQNAKLTFGLGFALLLILAGVYVFTANNAALQQTFFNWHLIGQSWREVLLAFRVNLRIAVLAEVLVLVFGLVLAIARSLPGRAGRPVRMLAIAYIDGLRAVPAIVVIYLIGFGVPLLNIPVLSGLSPQDFAVIALGMTYSAYVAETFRSGIELIHQSQWSASRSLGFSHAQTLRYVVLPQAIRGVIPPLLSAFIGLQKDTSLVNIIGTLDAFNQAKFYASTSFNLSSVTVVALLFVLITIPQTRYVDWQLARSATRRGRRGSI